MKLKTKKTIDSRTQKIEIEAVAVNPKEKLLVDVCFAGRHYIIRMEQDGDTDCSVFGRNKNVLIKSMIFVDGIGNDDIESVIEHKVEAL